VVVRQRQALTGEDWDLPVEQAHAAFQRALGGFVDASRPTPQPSPVAGGRTPVGRT
jgi:hypothetical protein